MEQKLKIKTVFTVASFSFSSMELLSTLNSLLSWLHKTLEQIRHHQTLGGDLASLQQQHYQLEVSNN